MTKPNGDQRFLFCKTERALQFSRPNRSLLFRHSDHADADRMCKQIELAIQALDSQQQWWPLAARYEDLLHGFGTSSTRMVKHRSQSMMDTNGLLFVSGARDAINHVEERPRNLTGSIIDMGDLAQ